MVRTQIQLTDEQHTRLKRWARRLDISFSEAVRRCVIGHLESGSGHVDRATMVREALAVCGSHRDPGGRTDVARRHDETLAEVYRR
ncbi:MAG: hypothetical protein IH939_09795 [Acidobacteria bacterium]|nr:hypothetical protein [Acidobacteriota bacterium]